MKLLLDEASLPPGAERWAVRHLSFTLKAGEVVALAEAGGLELSAVPLAEMQKVHSAITESVFNVLTVEASASSRTSYGGTSPVRVAEQVAQWKQRLRLE